MGLVLANVQRGKFPPPRQVKPDVPVPLEAICRKAMALKPKDRYTSPRNLADEIERWLADEAVTAHAEPWPARLGRWVRHHKGSGGGAAAAITVAITVGIAGWLVKEAKEREANEQGLRSIAEGNQASADIQRAEAETQRSRADRYLYFSRISLADRAWHEAYIPRMDELLEQTQPVHKDGDDFHGFERDYLLPPSSGELVDPQGTHQPCPQRGIQPGRPTPRLRQYGPYGKGLGCAHRPGEAHPQGAH